MVVSSLGFQVALDQDTLVLKILKSENPEIIEDDSTQLVISTTADCYQTPFLEVGHSVHVSTRRRDALRLKLLNMKLRVHYTRMALLYLYAYEAITGDIIAVPATEMIYSFMLNLIQSNRPVNFLTNLIQVKIDTCFVIARGIECGDAGARTKRFEHLERFVCLPCYCRANFVFCVNPENLA